MALALYNCRDKELIGVFATPSLAARYIYDGNYTCTALNKLSINVRRGHKFLKGTIFDFPVKLVYAKKELSELINEEMTYFINEEYPKPFSGKMRGFTSTRVTMYTKHTGIIL